MPTGFYKRPSIEDRFWSKVHKTDGCWLWTGAKSRSGYGQIGLDYKVLYTHRFSYETLVGPISHGMFVCHKCDVPLCVNPDHLFLGTNEDNLIDMIKKSRGTGKAINFISKLSKQDVLEIRRLENNNELDRQSIADKYGVTVSAIYNIVKNKTWKIV